MHPDSGPGPLPGALSAAPADSQTAPDLQTTSATEPLRGRARIRYLGFAFLALASLALAIASFTEGGRWLLPLALGILTLSAVTILWKLPQWQAESRRGQGVTEKELFDVENSARATLGQLIGTATLLAGLFFAWQQLGNTGQTLRVGEQGQITERFTRAVDQLGSDDVTIRLGGIYALERIARDSRRDAEPVMEVLTAYVRNQTPLVPIVAASPAATPTGARAGPAVDVQAVLSVISRRTTVEGETHCLDLSSTNLAGADLAGANLTNLCLRGADLSGANLAAANLTGSDLILADLHDANLDGARLNSVTLSKANLARANLHRADLTGARLDSANLGSAQLEETTLHNTVLIRADLSRALLFRADLDGAEMADAILMGTVLFGAQLGGAHSLTQEQIDSAFGIDDQTTLPPGISRPPSPKPGSVVPCSYGLTGATESSS